VRTVDDVGDPDVDESLSPGPDGEAGGFPYDLSVTRELEGAPGIPVHEQETDRRISGQISKRLELLLTW
jgi:hypothetical protein